MIGFRETKDSPTVETECAARRIERRLAQLNKRDSREAYTGTQHIGSGFPLHPSSRRKQFKKRSSLWTRARTIQIWFKDMEEVEWRMRTEKRNWSKRFCSSDGRSWSQRPPLLSPLPLPSASSSPLPRRSLLRWCCSSVKRVENWLMECGSQKRFSYPKSPKQHSCILVCIKRKDLEIES